MQLYELECAMTVPKPIGEVFSLFENPHNLKMITPESLGFEVLNKGDLRMRQGLTIDYRIRWISIPLRWKTLITRYEPPFCFVDEAVRSPYKLWRHTHTFTESPNGTHVRDRVEYALPLGPLGRLAHAAFVKRQLLGIFRYRQRTLRAHWGDGVLVNGPEIRLLDGLDQ